MGFADRLGDASLTAKQKAAALRRWVLANIGDADRLAASPTSRARHRRRLGEAIPGALANAVHAGTVVRWSAARVLGAILASGTSHNAARIPAAETSWSEERDHAIRNHYRKAFEKVAKAR